RIEEIRRTVTDEKKRKELILDELRKAVASGGLILLGMAGGSGGKKGKKPKQSSRTQYIEHHNHLNGILSSNDLIRLAYNNDYAQVLTDIRNSRFGTSPDVTNFYRTNNLLDPDGNIDLSSQSSENLERLAKELLSVNSQVNFNTGYLVRGVVINKIDPREYLKTIFKDLKKQGIDYIEVQSERLPGNLSYKDFQKIKKEFEQLENYQIKIGFLRNTSTQTLGRGPATTVNPGLRNIQNIEPGKDGVIGIDFAGPEATFTPRGMEYFQEIYREMARKAEEANKTMVIRVHVGEGNPATVSYNDKASTARNNVSLMIEAIETLRDNNQLSDKIILRLGHGTHASGANLDKIRQLGIIVEANLTSNLKTGSVRNKNEMDQVLLRFLYHDVKLTINTDGGGMMTTTLPKEYKQAREILARFRNNEIGVTVDITDPNTGAVTQRTYFYRDLPKDKKANFKPSKLTEEAWKYRNQITPTIPTN
ncbi:MAG: hypothetical protein ACFBSE_23125, partial [Prochloraceae cyanobacterium]